MYPQGLDMREIFLGLAALAPYSKVSEYYMDIQRILRYAQPLGTYLAASLPFFVRTSSEERSRNSKK